MITSLHGFTHIKKNHSFSVIGCVDIKTPPGGSVERDGNEAIITCDSTGQTKYITCKGSTWVGDVAECSEGGHMKIALTDIIRICIDLQCGCHKNIKFSQTCQHKN